VGMALCTEQLDLADAIVAPMKTDRPDGLWTTIVADELGQTLGLVYSDRESVREAVKRKCGAYHSRSRGLWVKGLTSGNTQELVEIALDCDRDAMRFIVKQGGEGFCHNHTWTCFGEDKGIGKLYRRLEKRRTDAPEGSYTKRLLDDPEFLSKKLVEEAGELAKADTRQEVIDEAADLLYFTFTRLVRAGISLSELEQELYLRSKRIYRRDGDVKPIGS
jgi:phosphoribosyl-ATP pyrophosphohydrolase